MFDLNKLGDMAKIASQAKQIQEKQDLRQQEQIEILKKISAQVNEIAALLKEKIK